MMNRNEQAIISARTELLDNLVAYFEPQSAILGIFLGGSLAAGNADAYSDIDFRLVVTKETAKNKLLRAFIQHFKNISFVETLAADYAVIHFEGFVKLDIFVYYHSELSPNTWLQALTILKDTNRFLENLQTQSQKLVYRPTQAEFETYLQKFYAWYQELYRRRQRGESNYAETCTLMLKNCLAAFWYMEKGAQPNSLGDWSKYEGARSKLTREQQAFLAEWTPVQAFDDFLEAINSQTLQALISLSEKFSLSFNKEKFSDIIGVFNV